MLKYIFLNHHFDHHIPAISTNPEWPFLLTMLNLSTFPGPRGPLAFGPTFAALTGIICQISGSGHSVPSHIEILMVLLYLALGCFLHGILQCPPCFLNISNLVVPSSSPLLGLSSFISYLLNILSFTSD